MTHVASKVAEILEIISDGNWHNLSKVQEEVKVPSEKMVEILGFLSKYEFLKVDYVNERVRVAGSVRKFLAENATI